MKKNCFFFYSRQQNLIAACRTRASKACLFRVQSLSRGVWPCSFSRELCQQKFCNRLELGFEAEPVKRRADHVDGIRIIPVFKSALSKKTFSAPSSSKRHVFDITRTALKSIRFFMKSEVARGINRFPQITLNVRAAGDVLPSVRVPGRGRGD